MKQRIAIIVTLIGAILILATPNAEAGWVKEALDMSFDRWGYSDALCFDAGYGAYPVVERQPLPAHVGAYADLQRCKIVFNSNFTFGPQRRCHVTIHEVGHLVGWRAPPGTGYVWENPDGTTYYDDFHSESDRHVMWPFVPTIGSRVHWRCKKAYPNDRYMERAWPSRRFDGRI